jgi:hypothetical protein
MAKQLFTIKDFVSWMTDYYGKPSSPIGLELLKYLSGFNPTSSYLLILKDVLIKNVSSSGISVLEKDGTRKWTPRKEGSFPDVAIIRMFESEAVDLRNEQLRIENDSKAVKQLEDDSFSRGTSEELINLDWGKVLQSVMHKCDETRKQTASPTKSQADIAAERQAFLQKYNDPDMPPEF